MIDREVLLFYVTHPIGTCNTLYVMCESECDRSQRFDKGRGSTSFSPVVSSPVYTGRLHYEIKLQCSHAPAGIDMFTRPGLRKREEKFVDSARSSFEFAFEFARKSRFTSLYLSAIYLLFVNRLIRSSKFCAY